MSVINDVRKVIQDLVAPELQEIKADVRGFKEEVKSEFKRLEEKMDANHRETLNALNVDKRLALLEQSLQTQHPKKTQ